MATASASAAVSVRLAARDVPARWAKLIDHTRCIGCHACSTACKSENAVPLGVHRTYVKSVDVGTFPHARRAFQVTRCNQCERAPCTVACPTSAMFRRPDGIVDFDKSACIGCKACLAACPYDAIFINPDDGAAEKCHMCAHRLDVGLEPACVVVCPTEAILVGDLDDPGSRVARAAGREPLAVRRPEKDTAPRLYYKGAHQATLDPLAARRPEGGLYMWSQQGTGTALAAAPTSSSAAALVSYDVAHAAPWGAKVSLYTWTKGIAAGAYLVALLLVAGDAVDPGGRLWAWVAPLVALAFLAVTGVLLLADLKRPHKVHLMLTRPQWRSWLVRGAVVLIAFAAVLAVHLLGSLVWPRLRGLAAWPGAPVSALAAAYTAFLFAQAKARDLWQNPLLPAQLLVQCLVAGAAALLPCAAALEPAAVPVLGRCLAAASGLHLVFVVGELGVAPVTAHARLAVGEMTRGSLAGFFWAGLGLMGAGLLAPWLPGLASLASLAGLAAYEHAYVQAGQRVPLA